MKRGEGLTTRELEARLGVSRRLVAGLVAAGLVTPARGRHGEYIFSFQDAVLIRTAGSLHRARVAPAQILRALRHLEQLKPNRHLAAVRIGACGGKVSARDHHGDWIVESGQRLMDFEARRETDGRVTELSRQQPAYAEADAALAQGLALEAVDVRRAEAAYRRAVSLHPGMLDAYLHLGCVLADQQRLGEAITLYEAALAVLPDEPALHFNLGVALEDTGATQAALSAYERSIELAPTDADAHYNAARLHQELGHMQKAIRHFNQYRRLERPDR
ncbi:tetratricopeptide repeat protein [Cupriavidus necator]|uniref:tetratricopeptide repeat protein n=1 Tax=Cupriavidus necator TaxID=106590 RepID=UPI002781BF80|nr:tetratricopeptide repeat protein [Cupriavidus necator]MDQ0142082.1 tetratricopeptide (TPR) repeat protein [Cupriavidus necator]